MAHQFLSKPCEPETLKAAIQRVCRIRDLFQDRPMREAIACVQWLPFQTHVYQELTDQVESSTASIERVAGIVARDVGMSAKVVQLVSSGFFGTPQRISNPAHAAKLLGLETLKAMLASSSTFQPGSEVGREEEFHRLAVHSLAVANAARRIAETLTADRTLIGDAHLAGFLHAVGRLALTGCKASSRANADATASTAGVADWLSRETVSDKGEPDPGGYLVALWGLPDPVVQAIAYHRVPNSCTEQPSVPLTAVHVANRLHERPDDATEEAIGFLDMAYLRTNGCVEHLDRWREEFRAWQSEGVLQ